MIVLNKINILLFIIIAILLLATVRCEPNEHYKVDITSTKPLVKQAGFVGKHRNRRRRNRRRYGYVQNLGYPMYVRNNMYPRSKRYCSTCGDKNNFECGQCVNCGTCVSERGVAKCVLGDQAGPYFREDCVQWQFNNPLNYFYYPWLGKYSFWN